MVKKKKKNYSMKINDIDLSGFRYDPSKDSEIKRLQKDFPQAFNPLWIENPKLSKHQTNIIRYIILLYDINSPLWETVKKHEERKIKALIMAGFEHGSDGKFDWDVENAILYGEK
jgi:hypothetical protein